jgi:hypothetical protein
MLVYRLQSAEAPVWHRLPACDSLDVFFTTGKMPYATLSNPCNWVVRSEFGDGVNPSAKARHFQSRPVHDGDDLVDKLTESLISSAFNMNPGMYRGCLNLDVIARQCED